MGAFLAIFLLMVGHDTCTISANYLNKLITMRHIVKIGLVQVEAIGFALVCVACNRWGYGVC